MQLICLNGTESVGKHPLFKKCVFIGEHGTTDLVSIAVHQHQLSPCGYKISIVRQSSAQLAVGDLPPVNKPVDNLLIMAQIFNLPECPSRNPFRQRLIQIAHLGQFDFSAGAVLGHILAMFHHHIQIITAQLMFWATRKRSRTSL